MSQTLYIFILILSSVAHDYHMSKTEIHYKTEQKSLQFTVNLFIDDLTLAIESEYEVDSLRLFEKDEHVLSDSLINAYILKHLLVNIDDKEIMPSYIGKELNGEDLEGMRCYLEVEQQEFFQNIEVSNGLLMNTFSDQRNILSILVDKKSKAHHLLDNSDYKKSIDI